MCGASVLLVEGDVSSTHALATVLREEGVNVITAQSGPEVFVRVAAQRPEAVIVDQSQGSMFATIAALAPHVPILLATSAAELVQMLERVLIATTTLQTAATQR